MLSVSEPISPASASIIEGRRVCGECAEKAWRAVFGADGPPEAAVDLAGTVVAVSSTS